MVLSCVAQNVSVLFCHGDISNEVRKYKKGLSGFLKNASALSGFQTGIFEKKFFGANRPEINDHFLVLP